jgi:hypothetical protein
MVDHAPDKTEADRRDRAREKAKRTVDGLAFYKLGADHHNEHERESDLPHNTYNNKINIMSERLPENGVMDKCDIILYSDKRLIRAALPFKEAVNGSRDQRYKNRKRKHQHRNTQIQKQCSYFGFIDS